MGNPYIRPILVGILTIFQMGWFNHQPAPGGLSSKKWVDSNQGSEYQTLAAKESTHAWKEYDLELRSEARKKVGIVGGR